VSEERTWRIEFRAEVRAHAAMLHITDRIFRVCADVAEKGDLADSELKLTYPPPKSEKEEGCQRAQGAKVVKW